MSKILLHLRKWNLARILWVAVGVMFCGSALFEREFILLVPGLLFILLGVTRKGCGCNQC